MQSKFEEFEEFNELPPEIKNTVAENLSDADLLRLAMTTRKHRELFQPLVDVRKISKLLNHVVRGEHDAVQWMLENDISLIFKKGKITDCSGREYENISPFEYALWALDKHMWAKMITCVPQNEDGKRIFELLIAQYNKVNTDGVTYRLNGKPITEQHFDFENTLIKELQTQVDSINAPGVKDLNAINKQWREGVGGAQKLLPIHIVYEYCSNEPFSPVPKFISQPKSSKQFYNWITTKHENWFNVASKLGSEFAICKGRCAVVAACEVWYRTGGAMAGLDLVAVTALCDVRTQDLSNLKSQLEEQASLHYQGKCNIDSE